MCEIVRPEPVFQHPPSRASPHDRIPPAGDSPGHGTRRQSLYVSVDSESKRVFLYV